MAVTSDASVTDITNAFNNISLIDVNIDKVKELPNEVLKNIYLKYNKKYNDELNKRIDNLKLSKTETKKDILNRWSFQKSEYNINIFETEYVFTYLYYSKCDKLEHYTHGIMCICHYSSDIEMVLVNTKNNSKHIFSLFFIKVEKYRTERDNNEGSYYDYSDEEDIKEFNMNFEDYEEYRVLFNNKFESDKEDFKLHLPYLIKCATKVSNIFKTEHLKNAIISYTDVEIYSSLEHESNTEYEIFNNFKENDPNDYKEIISWSYTDLECKLDNINKVVDFLYEIKE